MASKEQKVLIFSTAYFPFVGGAEIAIKEITDRLKNISFEMITPLYDRSLARREMVGSVLVHRLGVGIPFIDKMYVALFGAFYAGKIVREGRADVFWAMMVTFSSIAAFMHNKLFFWRKVPILLTLQEGDSEEYIKSKRLGLIGLTWRYALKNANHVTVISVYLEKLARKFGYEGGADLVPNGVEVEKFGRSFAPEEKDHLKKEVGVEGKKVLITTSRLSVKNGIDILIRSLKYLPAEVVFVVLGIGELKKELQDLAQEEGVEDRVYWLGLVSYDEIPLYLSISDVFVRPSRSEGMGNSFVEAMAAGVPVVATPVGGIVDFVFDPETSSQPTGFLAKTEDPESVAVKITEALTLGQKDKIVENARKLVKERYTWDSVAEKMRNSFK